MTHDTNAMMTYLIRNRSLAEESRPLTSHGHISIRKRPRRKWWNDEHHAHSLITRTLSGFKNPWKSFHKPTLWELVSGASLKRIEHPAHAVDERNPTEFARDSLALIQPLSKWRTPSQRRVRATWLGHAGVLVQFPHTFNPENGNGNATINVLVDPIFSERSSPAQSAGPSRIVKSPCTAADLPPIHVLIISHNHYDHLDLATVTSIYQKEQENIHIFVPLGNESLLASQGIPKDQITQCDWWEEHDFTMGQPDERNDDTQVFRITCTPAQHNSGRWGVDTNTSLWASWYMTSFSDATAASQDDSEPAFRLFFAGDTGLRFRDKAVKDHEWETCPIFQEIAERLGTPDLALLPISVGGVLPYVKSWDPAPAGFSLVPEIPDALISSTHMSPGDAVHLHKLFLGETIGLHAREINGSHPSPQLHCRKRMISMAIHFGTFCSGPAESRDTVRTLRRECKAKDVKFMKLSGEESVIEAGEESAFLVLDHGGSVEVAVQ